MQGEAQARPLPPLVIDSAEERAPPGLSGNKAMGILKNYPTASLYLTLPPGKIPSLFPLLQQGVMVKVWVGCTIRALLRKQFGWNSKYIEDRIKTIFLDGKTVDDVDSAMIKDGSTLALSAALPGLAGATLRRGGMLASFRNQITHREGEKAPRRQEGLIIVKLFNLIARDVGPTLLKEGVYVRPKDLERLLKDLPEEFWVGCRAARVDQKEIDFSHLRGMEWGNTCELVMLRVDCDGR